MLCPFCGNTEEFPPDNLQIGSNPDNLTSRTVDTVLRRNQSVHPPATIFFDYRNDANGEDEFQRLTIQLQSNTSGMSIDEFRGFDIHVKTTSPT